MTHPYVKAMKATDSPQIYRKLLRNSVGCGFCPVHDGENRKRRPKSDRHKSHRRK